MKKYLIILVASITAAKSSGQQLQTSSFYEVQSIMHNPSTAGVQGHGVVGATYRTQWSGIDGSPTTVNIFGSFALPKNGIGIGGYLYSDKTGPTSRTGMDLFLAKHIKMNKGVLSLGLEARLQQYAIDIKKLTETLGNDPVLGNQDNAFKFDAGFGASYTTDKFQIGASVSQLVQSNLNFYSGDLYSSAEARLSRHYYVNS